MSQFPSWIVMDDNQAVEIEFADVLYISQCLVVMDNDQAVGMAASL